MKTTTLFFTLLLLSLFKPAFATPETHKEQQALAKQLTQYFHAAARTNNIEVLQEFIKAGFPINQINHKGYNALMIATYHGNQQAFNYLLKQGANACAKDNKGNTALMAAIFRGEFQLAKKLIATECDVKATNKAGNSAFNFAQTFGQTQLLEYLKNQTNKKAKSTIKN